LKANNWNAGSAYGHDVRLKIEQMLCIIKGKEGKSPVWGKGETALGIQYIK